MNNERELFATEHALLESIFLLSRSGRESMGVYPTNDSSASSALAYHVSCTTANLPAGYSLTQGLSNSPYRVICGRPTTDLPTNASPPG